MDADRSFDFIPFPTVAPSCEPLVGHNRLYADRYHGSLTLELTALTPIFIAAGITALGSDVGETVSLIRVMGQDSNGNPILQGTSLKGCLRAVYETITNSTLGVKGAIVPLGRAPLPARRGASLSPAELVFGALGFQGLLSIVDAIGDRPLEVGYLPPMYQPERGNGRKFYHHQRPGGSTRHPFSDRSAEPAKPPSPIQQAPAGTVFTTTLRFSNLTLAQLGTILIALGLDSDYAFALKLGAGKGKGLGSVKVRLMSHAIASGSTLTQTRYLDYQPPVLPLPPQDLVAPAIKIAHTKLIHQEQLEQVRNILQPPGANV